MEMTRVLVPGEEMRSRTKLPSEGYRVHYFADADGTIRIVKDSEKRATVLLKNKIEELHRVRTPRIYHGHY